MSSEYWAKVALLASLSIVCAARPVIILAREALARRERRRAAARRRRSQVGLLALRWRRRRSRRSSSRPARPARSVAGPFRRRARRATSRSRSSTRRTSSRSRRSSGGRSQASRSRRSRRRSSNCPGDRRRPAAAPGRRSGAADRGGDADRQGHPGGTTTSFKRVLDLALDRTAASSSPARARPTAQPPAPVAQPKYATQPKGVGAFRKLRLVNVAPKLGLDFQQGAFRYSMAYDQQAMMGGGVCWLDYNNDGWLDLFAVNSYADVDHARVGRHTAACRRARSSGTSTGKFVNVSKDAHANIRVKGTGCAAADLNGDGYTDLVVTTATGVEMLWNNGNGGFTAQALAGAVRLVRRRRRRGRERRRPAGHLRRRLHEHGRRRSRARSPASRPTTKASATSSTSTRAATTASRRSASQAGLESSHFRHGLGATFTDVNGDGRPDLYVANDEDPNDLYINEPGGPLGFHFVDEAKAYGVADTNAGHGRRRGRLQRRRPSRPVHHELARPAARRVRERDPARTARPPTET